MRGAGETLVKSTLADSALLYRREDERMNDPAASGQRDAGPSVNVRPA